MNILPTSTGITEAIDALKQGKVIAHATETCYGLACDLENQAAVARLFTIKQRPHNKPLSALFASIEHAKQFVEWNELAETLATQHLPGPLTLVLNKKSSANLWVTPDKTAKIGVRISSHPTARALAEQFGGPLSTTSANVSEQENPYSPTDIETQYSGLSDQPDLLLDDGQLTKQAASTVIDVSNGEVTVLREGAVDLP